MAQMDVSMYAVHGRYGGDGIDPRLRDANLTPTSISNHHGHVAAVAVTGAIAIAGIMVILGVFSLRADDVA